MKNIWLALSLSALALPSWAATSVGVSIGIDEPGIYGRVDIGRVSAPPVLVYQRPVVIVPTPVSVYQSPIYLHVPPGQAKNWRRHCSYYGACNRPVYFVQENWYRSHYAHDYHRDHPVRYKQHGKGHGKHHDKHDD